LEFLHFGFPSSKDEEISELNTKLAEMTAHTDDINSQKDELLCDNERHTLTIFTRQKFGKCTAYFFLCILDKKVPNKTR
jgi:hypothetical protein